MNNQKLDEVRRTLQHLQHIASEPIDENDSPGRDAIRAADRKSGRGRIIGKFFESVKHVFARPTSPIIGLAGQPTPVIGIGAIAVVGMVVLAGWAFVGTDEEPVSTVDTATTSVIELSKRQASDAEPAVTSAISEAQRLISAGKINEARRRLIDLDVKSPEAALTLARSYDPNYLRLIPGADAAADAKEAERWYRTWRDIAARKGLVLEADRLDRIINAMH